MWKIKIKATVSKELQQCSKFHQRAHSHSRQHWLKSAVRCQSSKLLRHSTRWYLSRFHRISPTMTSPIRRHVGAPTNLLTIPQKQEGREGNRWKGRRMVSKGHNAHSLPPPPRPLYFRLPPSALLSLERSTNARELRLTISLTILYTSAAEQWRTTTKNSGNRGTALLLLRVAPACPSIHIGLQRLTGAKETAGEGGGERRGREREGCAGVWNDK